MDELTYGSLDDTSFELSEVRLPSAQGEVLCASDVVRIRVEFAGNGACNKLELIRKAGLGTSWAELSREARSLRRSLHKDLNRRNTKQLFDFVVRVSGAWPELTKSPKGEGDLSWGLWLYGYDGSELRVRRGVGCIPEPEAFLAFARGLESLSRGFCADTMPLARIEAALEWRNPFAYDERLDVVAGGAIACALGLDYFAEGMVAQSPAHRDESLREARLHFLDATGCGSARAYAYLGRLALGLLGERDVWRARHSLEQAVKGQSPEGCYLMADLMRNEDEGSDAELRDLYERACALAVPASQVEVWSVCAARLAEWLLEHPEGESDLTRARDLVVEAELGLNTACNSGMEWLKPELEQAREISERLHSETGATLG